MVNQAKKTIEDEAAAIKKEDKESMAADVQSHLLSNYRDALKRGDKGAAKSCLLAARCFAENDSGVANEIYTMAISDGDIGEASRSFADIFNHLLESSRDESKSKAYSSETESIICRIKTEVENLLSELKTLHLKLKTPSTPVASATKQSSSNNHDDKPNSRGSALKAINNPSAPSFSYEKLFNNLSDETKRNVFDYAIEICDDPIEKCKLLMLDTIVFSDDIATRGSRLLQSLIDLTDSNQDHDKQSILSASNEINYQPDKQAKSLLVLDAIPLVLNKIPISSLDINATHLLDKTLSFVSENCVEEAAKEHEISNLHEEVKKFIARRILGLDGNFFVPTETEEYARNTFILLTNQLLDSFTNDKVKIQLEQLKSVVMDSGTSFDKMDQLGTITDNFYSCRIVDDDVPGKVNKEETSKPVVTTPPPKARGRPKKMPQTENVANVDDAAKRIKTDSANEEPFIFYTILQHMFGNLSNYLRNTRSRVIMDFENPLIDMIEVEPTKSSSQRTSRSKTGSQQTNELMNRTPKKIKLEVPTRELDAESNEKSSPLNSGSSRKMDMQVVASLAEAHKCIDFLTSRFGKKWSEYIERNNLSEFVWFQRFVIDGNMITRNFDNLSCLLKVFKISQTANKETLEAHSVTILRIMIQDISTSVIMADRTSSLEKIDKLFKCMTKLDLLVNHANYESGDSMEEYKIIVPYNEQAHMGFMFFDLVSLIRYCVDILMKILKKFMTNSNSITDTLIGNLIVLAQFDWPKEYQSYQQCLTWIRSQKPKSTTPQSLSASTKFTYHDFFLYVRNPTIIEDFMAMLRHGYTLDIKGATTNGQTASNSQSRNGNGNSVAPSRSNKVITTRGVNKTFKEDLKVAFVSQMKVSSFVMPLDVISEFIQTSLVPYLKSLKR